eukprot:935741_1
MTESEKHTQDWIQKYDVPPSQTRVTPGGQFDPSQLPLTLPPLTGTEFDPPQLLLPLPLPRSIFTFQEIETKAPNPLNRLLPANSNEGQPQRIKQEDQPEATDVATARDICAAEDYDSEMQEWFDAVEKMEKVRGMTPPEEDDDVPDVAMIEEEEDVDVAMIEEEEDVPMIRGNIRRKRREIFDDDPSTDTATTTTTHDKPTTAHDTAERWSAFKPKEIAAPRLKQGGRPQSILR